MSQRGSGILLHISSLPSPFGIGDLGPGAYRFADFLAQASQRYWEVLPLNPTLPISGHAPYSSVSAFAGNLLLISPELLRQEGLVEKADLQESMLPEGNVVDYGAAAIFKEKILRIACTKFRQSPQREGFAEFCRRERSWLDDYALFTSIRNRYRGKAWSAWPEALRDRQPEIIGESAKTLAAAIEREKFLQYLFFKQWCALKEYCRNLGVLIIGDMPIYINHDSADVWAHPDLFKLDEQKRPAFVAGVPPDFFSKTGQLWGNPVYDWDSLRRSGFKWLLDRFEHNFGLYDLLRVDHFRGYVGYWEIPAGEKTAVKGRWVEAPARELLEKLAKRRHGLPIIAEDLGMIDAKVREIMRDFHIPGMRPLLFAFGENMAHHSSIPHNVAQGNVIYTGTHDLNTARGWFETETTDGDRRRLSSYAGRKVTEKTVSWTLIRLAMASPADTAIIPMQDVLSLGAGARMNKPGTTKGNWQWRLGAKQLTTSLARRLYQLTALYGRD
ncbi:MAG: 4-alpha-glucanotransferase [Smithellaceae bacterium]|nr:4-alpha-glucanotransferase [Smithellaceae bacterium]